MKELIELYDNVYFSIISQIGSCGTAFYRFYVLGGNWL